MKLEEFLSLVTPSGGIRFITLIQKKDGKKFSRVANEPYTTTAAGVELVEEADTLPDFNVYFSLASYEKAEYVDDKGKRRTRTALNATYARAIWRDLDVGEGKPNAYASKADALDAVKKMCKAINLPHPLLVDSGNGIHAYWPFSRDVTKEEWLRLAGMAAQVFPRFGMKSDPSRDCDIASVLRPIGTTNKGKNADKPVQEHAESGEFDAPIDPDEFASILSPHAVTDSLDAIPAYLKGKAGAAESLAKHREFPPSYAKVIAKKCLQIAHFKETGGSDYTTWLMGLGIIKHTVEGEALAHKWASKHEDYKEADTQAKLDSLDGGPPTCASFGDANGLCGECEFRTRVRSPITLGYEESAPPQEIAAPTEEDPEATVHLPAGYVMHDGHLCQRLVVDGIVVYARITKTLFWLTERWDPSGEMVLSAVCRVREQDNGKWQYRHFSIPAGLIGKGGSELHAVLGQNEIFAVSDKGAKARMDAIVATMADDLKQRAEHSRAYKVYGWQDDGSFVMGERRLTADGESQAKLWGDSAIALKNTFSKNGGSAAAWSEIVEAMYGHPNHEIFQIVVLFGIGAPLLRFYQMPTGCLVNMVGKAGTGKTTTARVGLSAYGNPDMMLTELRSTTELALYNQIATMHSMPVCVDELTGVDPMRASTMTYSIMNGQPRQGLLSSGKRRESLEPWQNVNFASANGSIVDVLASFKGDATAELSRLIELNWDLTGVTTIQRRDMDTLYAGLRENYGSIGREFVQWIMRNRAEAERIVLQTREFIEDELSIGRENRFWSAHIAIPIATKMIVEKMGYLNAFDFNRITDVCLTTIRDHKTAVKDLTMNGIDGFHALLNSISDRIITTRNLKDGRFATPDAVTMNGEPMGRAIIEDNVLYISVAAVREWCSVKRMNVKDMRRELREAEMLDSDARFYLGRGTTRVTGQTFCWKLNLSRVIGVPASHLNPTAEGHLKLVKS